LSRSQGADQWAGGVDEADDGAEDLLGQQPRVVSGRLVRGGAVIELQAFLDLGDAKPGAPVVQDVLAGGAVLEGLGGLGVAGLGEFLGDLRGALLAGLRDLRGLLDRAELALELADAVAGTAEQRHLLLGQVTLVLLGALDEAVHELGALLHLGLHPGQ
jgi:hypothetical protein